MGNIGQGKYAVDWNGKLSLRRPKPTVVGPNVKCCRTEKKEREDKEENEEEGR